VNSNVIESEGQVITAECEEELTTRGRSAHNLLMSSSASNVKLHEVVTSEWHSTLSRLLRVTAYVLRFIRMLKNKRCGHSAPAQQL